LVKSLPAEVQQSAQVSQVAVYEKVEVNSVFGLFDHGERVPVHPDYPPWSIISFLGQRFPGYKKLVLPGFPGAPEPLGRNEKESGREKAKSVLIPERSEP
jgi:hypothetical protein